MKSMKIILPAIIAAIFMAFLYSNVNRNIKISKVESELSELRLFSHELKTVFGQNLDLLKKSAYIINDDTLIGSNNKYNAAMNHYLKSLANLDQKRLYPLSKILTSKQEALNTIYEDIKTDNAVLKNSIIWAKTAYKKYMNNKTRVSNDDRRYLNHLFNITIGSTTAKLQDFKYITSLKNTDLLNKHLKMIYTTKVRLNNSNKALHKNDITHEINEVIRYTHELSSTLRQESAEITSNLLYASLALLLLALAIYIKELQATKELEKTQNELHEFFDALNESSIVSKSDLSGKITYVNDKFCEISGYSREELMGKAHNIVRHPSMESAVFKSLWDTIQANKIFKGIIKNRKKDGGMYIVDTTVIPLHDEEGNIIEYLSVRHDLTHTLHMVL